MLPYHYIGFISGLIVPPVVTKMVLEPIFIQRKYEEIDNIKLDVDYIGWHVRNLEEERGMKEEEVYVPVSYFQGRY